MEKIQKLIRPNIRNLVPYSSARDEYTGEIGVFLDANENSFGSLTDNNYNRYPDPYQGKLKIEIGEIKGVAPENMFLGNGSDEAIDLLVRIFCEPGRDSIMILPPTYGMYGVCADVNDVKIESVPLTPDFVPDVEAIRQNMTDRTKLIFLCSPNNPSGNQFPASVVEEMLSVFQGIVVLDEAYVDFALDKSWLSKLQKYPNLVILQTFSKAWGLAGIRLGMAFASEYIITVMNKVKYPYNVNQRTMEVAMESLQKYDRFQAVLDQILDERTKLIDGLKDLTFVEKIYPTDSNFILVKFKDGLAVFKYLLDRQIIVRNRTTQTHCDNALRITVGKPEENQTLLDALREF